MTCFKPFVLGEVHVLLLPPPKEKGDSFRSRLSHQESSFLVLTNI
jgi:hypothetical protein